MTTAWTRLTPAQAHAWLCERPDALLLDAREAPHHAAAHLAGSLRLFRDGTLQLTLGFSGSTVWAETLGASAPPASLATLPEGAAESLRKALDDATP